VNERLDIDYVGTGDDEDAEFSIVYRKDNSKSDIFYTGPLIKVANEYPYFLEAFPKDIFPGVESIQTKTLLRKLNDKNWLMALERKVSSKYPTKLISLGLGGAGILFSVLPIDKSEKVDSIEVIDGKMGEDYALFKENAFAQYLCFEYIGVELVFNGRVSYSNDTKRKKLTSFGLIAMSDEHKIDYFTKEETFISVRFIGVSVEAEYQYKLLKGAKFIIDREYCLGFTPKKFKCVVTPFKNGATVTLQGPFEPWNKPTQPWNKKLGGR